MPTVGIYLADNVVPVAIEAVDVVAFLKRIIIYEKNIFSLKLL